tara:strand:- start:131254 stop:131649 length:396 start_codon:yes stop_codon:yes gene_type:complete
MLKRPLLLLLLPFCLLAITGSFFRFFVTADYIVEYENECTPGEKACFIGTDEDTGDLYYYSLVRKHAVNLRNECGTDITDCELATTCNPTNTHCSITFCTPDLGNCTIEVPAKQPSLDEGNGSADPNESEL